MRWFGLGSGWLTFLLCALVVALPALAYASPPDPSWVRGVYDDADFDDIVCLIIASSGLVDGMASASRSPLFILAQAEPPQNERPVAFFTLTSLQPRAPPAL